MGLESSFIGCRAPSSIGSDHTAEMITGLGVKLVG